MSVPHDSAVCADEADDDAAAVLWDGDTLALCDGGALGLWDDAAAAPLDGGALVLALCTVLSHAANTSTSTISAMYPLTPRTALVLLASARTPTPKASLNDLLTRTLMTIRSRPRD
jgi:hypothetical protein